MATIRDYGATTDRPALRACFVELQDVERAIDSRLPPGESIADDDLDVMFQRCREFRGVVLVAETEGHIAGFVTIWTRYCSSEPDDNPAEHGYITDLVVSASQRGRGIGRQLLDAAEMQARKAGSTWIELSVKAGNRVAQSLYASAGYSESEIHLAKPLAPLPLRKHSRSD